MRRLWLFVRGVAATLVLAAACAPPPLAATPTIRLVDADGSVIEVRGLESAARQWGRTRPPDSDQWDRLCSVHVQDSQGQVSPTPVVARYVLAGGALRISPLFPLEPGRPYEVRCRRDPADPGRGELVRATVSRPPRAPSEPTIVTAIHPGGAVWPANLLRIYVHFSAPMGRRSGLAHVTLLDERGQPVIDPFLPVDADLWNEDRTRFTLFLDPGRQKRDILPNRQMGSSLAPGRRYTLVIDRGWLDGEERPLASDVRHAFRVGPPERRALDVSAWRLAVPPPGGVESLTVAFGRSLDHALARRTLEVRRDGQAIEGAVEIRDSETRWTFTPRLPWQPGRYELVALPVLEDPSGNRIGRAFEVTGSADDAGDASVPAVVGFRVAAGPPSTSR